MVFADLIFLYIFLPLSVIFYYKCGSKQGRNAVLILFSLFFYAWGEPVWIVLLLFSATIDYIHGIVIENNPGTALAKLMLFSSLVLNLGLLGIFKYGDFIVSTINGLTGLKMPLMGFSLPIGISFYTFQTISYTVDVYRGEVKAQRSFGKFLLFVSLFHQLVAGPIVRYKDVANDIDNRCETMAEFSKGVTRFCIGLSKKAIIANTAGSLGADFISKNPAQLTTLGSWFGVVMFALQIYYDFSGYSDMAIGLGYMFGFHYVENFNYPYVSTSATEFWRRWHISLGSFFRDYLYIPLGGGRSNAYRNLFITWFATGLWHGASLNFIVWGLYYGVLIAIERLFLRKLLDKLPRAVGHIYLTLAMLIGWVLFIFEDLSMALEYIKVMFGVGGAGLFDISTGLIITNNIFWILWSLAFCAPIVPKLLSKIKAGFPRSEELQKYIPLMNFILLAVSTAMLVGESYNPFLYFRF